MKPLIAPREELHFGDIIHGVKQTFASLPDRRVGQNRQIKMLDAALSAFSVFFMQSPSFLDYQRMMLEHRSLDKNNVQTLFGVHRVPCDNQIRHLLDVVSPRCLDPIFNLVFNRLNQSGIIEAYRSLNKTVLLAIDGTTYFSSQALHCPNCSTRQSADGTTHYSHSVLTPVLVKPGEDKVIPLSPEFIQPQDGQLNLKTSFDRVKAQRC